MFTWKAYVSRLIFPGFLGENPTRRVRQINAARRRRNPLRSLIQQTDLNRSATGCPSRDHVPPAVAHHETSLTVDVESMDGVEKQTRFWLAALAFVIVVVRADENRVYAKLTLNHGIHSIHY
jgi:hypothetical protein